MNLIIWKTFSGDTTTETFERQSFVKNINLSFNYQCEDAVNCSEILNMENESFFCNLKKYYQLYFEMNVNIVLLSILVVTSYYV